MAILTITEKKGRSTLSLPRRIYIGGQYVGMMNVPTVKGRGKVRMAIPKTGKGDNAIHIELPAGGYAIRVESSLRWFGASANVRVREGYDNHLDFADREKVWDALFILDIILWCIKGVLHLGSPWSWIYEIFTNGYFVAWIIYEYCIRNKYFHMDAYSKLRKEDKDDNTTEPPTE